MIQKIEMLVINLNITEITPTAFCDKVIGVEVKWNQKDSDSEHEGNFEVSTSSPSSCK